MKKALFSLFASIVAAGALAACNSGGSSSTPGTGTNCGGPPTTFQMIYPVPNSSGAPSGIQQLYFASSKALPSGSSYGFYIFGPAGQVGLFSSQYAQISLSQIPTPRATPSFSNPVYYAANYAPYTLQSGSTYNVYWNDLGSGCSPNVQITGGTFTVQ
jgi:hypothetical protein